MDKSMIKILPSIFYTILFFLVQIGLFYVSYAFKNNLLFALQFLPQAYVLSCYLIFKPTRWYKVFTAEIFSLLTLSYFYNEYQYLYILLLFSFTRFYFVLFLKKQVTQALSEWESLRLGFSAIICQVAANYLILFMLSFSLGFSKDWVISMTLYTLTGLLILFPLTKLLYNFIGGRVNHVKHFRVVGPSLKFVIVACLLYSIFVLIEVFYSNLLPSLTAIFALSPIFYFAYHFLWRGSCLAVLVNACILLFLRFCDYIIRTEDELLALLALQGVIGLLVGIMTSRQYLLEQQAALTMQQLSQELNNKNKLAVKLVTIEEDIKKNIARELHDEVGQNITAIQIHAHLIERQSIDENVKKNSKQISQLAKNIHLSIRALLFKLRPILMDEVGLNNAITQLLAEMRFLEQGICVTKKVSINEDAMTDVTKITLYRIIQELLNNIIKHAKAKNIQIYLVSDSLITLRVIDDGIGFSHDWRDKGQGLKGIQERVRALGGALRYLSSDVAGKKNQVIVSLLTKEKQTF